MTTLTRAQLLPFFDLRREIKFAQNPQTVIVRAYDPTDGTALVEKKYSGVLSNLQVRENELLFAVAQRNVGGVELTSRIAALRSYSKHSVQGGHEILVKWYGFDLDDWYTLLSGAPNNPFHQARFLLELLRAALKSLHLLHDAGFVHCDVHNGNWCLPSTGATLELDGRAALRFTLNPDALKLIDLGLSLKPAADRGLPPRLHDAGGGVGEVITLNGRASPPHPRRLVAALDRARLGDLAPWQALDWRLDLWRLGALIDVWRDTAGEADGLTGPKPLRVLLADLADALKQPEQAALTGAAAPLVLPHEAWVKAITDAIGAPQAMEVRIGLQPAEAKLLAALAPKPKATPAPTPAPAPAPAPTPAPDPKIAGSRVSWLKRLASVVAVLGLGLGGTSWWVTKDRAKSATTDSLSVATSVPSNDRLEAFAGGPVLIRLPQATEDLPGTLLGDANGRPDEKPPYRVRVPYKLAIGETEVTFAQWDQCVAEKGCDYTPSDQGWGRGDRPVINVSWDDVQKYLHWASRKAGVDPYSPHRLRLPTEAEWEYAARAGSDGEFSLGPTNSNPLTPGEANYDSKHQYKGGPTGVPRGQTVPVKSFQPNAFGLYDMHGNVSEWAQDCYAGTEYDRRADKKGWLASQTNEERPTCPRVLRGGSWSNLPQYLRSADRNLDSPGGRNFDFGFRLARTLP